MTRGREWLLTTALTVGAVVVVLTGAETVLRLRGYAPLRFRNTARLIAPRWELLLDCYPTNPRGYFDIDLRRPESREQYLRVAPHRFDAVAERAPWAVESRFNSRRFRGAEFAPKRPGVVRVVIVGDSFTEGQGVKEADTYPRALERLLNAELPGRFEVLNCGRRGTDFPELFAVFEEALALAPDVLVYAMVLNDAARSPGFQARQSYLNDWILDRGRMLEGQPPPELRPLDSRLLAFVHDRLESWRIGRDTARWYLDMYDAPNREGWERTQGYIREMNRRVREQGGAFLLAWWPLMVNLEGRDPFARPSETVARFCVAAGIPRHDLRPALAGRRTESLWVHPVDMHPNETAHRLAAESLSPVVRTLPR
ncbi:MAG TPA: SGNH/GDSL hydrolase family protein [Vicinamibacteria bacterium]|jgi:lysophospholipase L1-like esterase